MTRTRTVPMLGNATEGDLYERRPLRGSTPQFDSGDGERTTARDHRHFGTVVMGRKIQVLEWVTGQ